MKKLFPLLLLVTIKEKKRNKQPKKERKITTTKVTFYFEATRPVPRVKSKIR
jgi:hypothetical protein